MATENEKEEVEEKEKAVIRFSEYEKFTQSPKRTRRAGLSHECFVMSRRVQRLIPLMSHIERRRKKKTRKKDARKDQKKKIERKKVLRKTKRREDKSFSRKTKEAIAR